MVPVHVGAQVESAGQRRRLARQRRLRRSTQVKRAERARAVALRALGLTLQAAADQLAAEGFTRPKGGTWTPSAVASALRSHALDQQAAA